jgi:2-C-methyl-D-erythritol 4-phosphate cytidylyltransferase
VALGLAALDKALDYILVHDGVRPLIDQRTIERVLVAARETGAATAAIPVQDTLAKVDKKNNVSDMPSRERLWLIQTPQAFWRPILEEAQEKAWADDHLGTDEAGLVLRISKPVSIVEGSPLNFKLTTSHDLRLAEAILRFGEV